MLLVVYDGNLFSCLIEPNIECTRNDLYEKHLSICGYLQSIFPCRERRTIISTITSIMGLTFKHIFITYLENSNLHGARFTVEKENHFTEKLVCPSIQVFLLLTLCLFGQIILGDLYYIGMGRKWFPHYVRMGCIPTQCYPICR